MNQLLDQIAAIVGPKGLLTGEDVSSRAADWLGLANLRTFGTRFRGQVWPGDVLKLSGRITSVDRSAGTAVEAELTLTDEAGEVKVQGWARAVLPV